MATHPFRRLAALALALTAAAGSFSTAFADCCCDSHEEPAQAETSCHGDIESHDAPNLVADQGVCICEGGHSIPGQSAPEAIRESAPVSVFVASPVSADYGKRDSYLVLNRPPSGHHGLQQLHYVYCALLI